MDTAQKTTHFTEQESEVQRRDVIGSVSFKSLELAVLCGERSAGSSVLGCGCHKQSPQGSGRRGKRVKCKLS